VNEEKKWVISKLNSHYGISKNKAEMEVWRGISEGLTAVIINLVIVVVLTLILRAVRVPEGPDETLPQQYTAEPDEVPGTTPAGVGAHLEG